MSPRLSKARHLDAVMQTIGTAVAGMDVPAVEKISESQQEQPFQVLIATLLSARTQDATTHVASTRLFSVAPTPQAVAALSVKKIEALIKPVSFYKTKAKHVKETCRLLLERFNGVVPGTMEELTTLPGVGRKTANLVLILSFRSQQNICVDTHVHRIANTMGWVDTKTPEETEHALYQVADPKWWANLNLYLVMWGQNVCRPAYPRCGACAVETLCPKRGVTRVSKRGVGDVKANV